MTDSTTDFKYDIPDQIQSALDRYVEQKLKPGSFTYAVLCNDLHSATMHADNVSIARIKEICSYVWNELPAECWGTKEVVDMWLAPRVQP